MISTGYIHAQDDLWFFESNYHESMTFIDGVLGELAIRGMQGDTMRNLGVYTESQDEYYAESAADAVRKLGEKVIEIINRIKEFIKTITGKIRGIGIKHKALGKDFAKIEKENPELAEKIKIGIASGDIDFATMRGISDYYKEIDKIVADIEKNKVDPKSLRGRLDAAKKKLNENQETVKSIAAALGLVVSAVGLFVTARQITMAIQKHNTNCQTQTALHTAAKDKLEKKLQMYQKAKNPPASVFGELAMVASDVERTGGMELTKRMKFVEKLGTKMDNAIKAVYNKLGKTPNYAKKQQDKLQRKINKESQKLAGIQRMSKAVNEMQENSKSDAEKARDALDAAEKLSKKTLNDQQVEESKLRMRQSEEIHGKKMENLQKEGQKIDAQTNAAKSQVLKNASEATQNRKTQETQRTVNESRDWANIKQGESFESQKQYWDDKNEREKNRKK